MAKGKAIGDLLVGAGVVAVGYLGYRYFTTGAGSKNMPLGELAFDLGPGTARPLANPVPGFYPISVNPQTGKPVLIGETGPATPACAEITYPAYTVGGITIPARTQRVCTPGRA